MLVIKLFTGWGVVPRYDVTCDIYVMICTIIWPNYNDLDFAEIRGFPFLSYLLG